MQLNWQCPLFSTFNYFKLDNFKYLINCRTVPQESYPISLVPYVWSTLALSLGLWLWPHLSPVTMLDSAIPLPEIKMIYLLLKLRQQLISDIIYIMESLDYNSQIGTNCVIYSWPGTVYKIYGQKLSSFILWGSVTFQSSCAVPVLLVIKPGF